MWSDKDLEQLKKDAKLSPEKKGRILSEMLHKIEAGELLREARVPRRIWQRSVFKPIYTNRMPIFAGILLAALLGGGTSMAAQNTLPGDLLYPVKVGVNERVEGAFQISPEAKASWESLLASRRLDEAAKLQAEGKLSAGTKKDLQLAFEEHAKNAENRLSELKDSGKADSAANLALDLEASLRARNIILNSSSTATNTISFGEFISSINKIRHDAEDELDNSTSTGSIALQNAAQIKIDAASTTIDAAASFISTTTMSTSTKAEFQAKLDEAIKLLSDARAKYAAGDYRSAFHLAQDSWLTAKEMKFTGEIRLNLGLGFGFHGDRNNNEDNSSSSSSDSDKNGRDRGRGSEINSTTTASTTFQVKTRGDDDNENENRNDERGGIRIRLED